MRVVEPVGDARLRYHLTPAGAVWRHQLQGRNHVLLDPQARSRALSPAFARPIELWGAARWQGAPSATVIRYPGEQNGGRPVRMNGSRAAVRDPGAAELPDGGAMGERGHGEQALDEPPVAGPVVNRRSVVDFVGDVSAFRLGTLGLLLDAVASALDGGHPVVLAAPDAEQGALWIGAVSFFAPPITCLRLSFSTSESLDQVLADLEAENQRADAQLVESLSSVTGRQAQLAGQAQLPGRGRPRERARFRDLADENSWRTPIISVVPQRDVEILSRRPGLPVILVDPRVESTIRGIGGVDHRENQLGQTIPVTDWSRLAQDASCEDFSALERCLQRLDEVSLSGPAGGGPIGADWWPIDLDAADDLARSAGPAWPLAAAVALGDDLPLALPTAARVILRDTPAARRRHGELAGTVSSLVSTTVQDAEQAWQRMSSALAERPARTALLQAAFESYLRLAMQDDDWLLREAVPLPEPIPGDDGLAARLRAPATALAGRLAAAPDDVRTGVLVLRAIDLLHRLRQLVPGSARPLDLNDLGTRAARLLLSEHGSRVAELTGPIDTGALADWVVPPVAYEAPNWPGAGRRPGLRLPPAVLGLLAAGLDVERIVRLPSPKDLGAEPVAAEVACAITGGRMAGDARLRGPAVEYLLYLATQAYGDDDPQALVDEVFGRVADSQAWRAAPLLRLMQRAQVPVAGYLVPVIYAHVEDWADDEDGAKLAAAMLKRVEFLPQRDRSGQVQARRAGVADPDIPVLNLLAATGPGWLEKDDGLHHRACDVLMWADRAWAGLTEQRRAVIAPRVTVAAFMVALAAEPAQAGVALRSRIGLVPMGGAWRPAVPAGLERSLPMARIILSLNNYRLAGELVCSSTRTMVDPPEIEELPDLPRLCQLPIGPVVRHVVAGDETGRLAGHLAALVEQELREHDRRNQRDGHPAAVPEDRADVLDFWRGVLLEATVQDPAVIVEAEPEPVPSPEPFWDVVAVAFGAGRSAVANVVRTDLRSMLDTTGSPEGSNGQGPVAERRRVPWWQRWWGG